MNRTTFVGMARETLLKDRPDVRALSEVGRSSELLSPKEANGLEFGYELPSWLKEDLGLVQTFAPSSNYSSATVRRSQTYRCKPPRVVGGAVLPAAFQQDHGRSPDVSLISGKGATFLLRNFTKAAFLDDGYIPEMTDTGNLWCWQVMKDRPAHHLPGRTLMCVVEGAAIFTHWLLDTLPRLEILKQQGMRLTDFDQVVFTTVGASFHQEALTVLRVDRKRVLTRKDLGVLISCDEFSHVTAVRSGFFAPEGMYDAVRDVFRPDDRVNEPRRRIYIARSFAKRRRILNEAELLPILERHGFEIVHAEKFGIRDMAALCAAATHVVAPHGAGLANLVFVPRGAKVLELYGAHLSAEYWTICNQIGHEYFCLQGTDATDAPYTADRISRMGYYERNGADMKIDPVLFAEALEQIAPVSPSRA